MALTFEKDDGKCTPRMTCDGCHQLLGHHDAIAVYVDGNDTAEALRSSVLLSHTGSECETAVDSVVENESARIQERGALTDCLVMLAGSAGLTPTVFADKYTDLVAQGRLPAEHDAERENYANFL